MERILNDLQIREYWYLMPMVSGDLQSTNLGTTLTDALIRVRQRQQQVVDDYNQHHDDSDTDRRNGPVIFLGMDSPETPLDEIEAIFTNKIDCLSLAFMCPAHDGGYGLLSVPPGIPADQVFAGVRWSDSLTAISQLKALSDAGVSTRLGRLMYDIDEPDDVHSLFKRLQVKGNVPQLSVDEVSLNTSLSLSSSSSSFDVLLSSSSFPGKEKTGNCYHTNKTLLEILRYNHDHTKHTNQPNQEKHSIFTDT
jgi:glycosyltransferase A (GT-A) superfamily protein (DUF2064 family)